MSSTSSTKPSNDPEHVAKDVLAVLKTFDKDGNGQLDAAESKQLREMYSKVHATPAMMNKLTAEEKEAFRVLQQRYDKDNDGTLDANELAFLEEDIRSTDTAARYAAYLARLTSLWRYAAYTSDLGEAFRPMAHPYMVRATYGTSWAYVLGDVAWEGKRDYDHGVRGNTLYQHVVKRATFQAIASMALPAFTIHSVVHLMKDHVFKNSSPRLKALGPTLSGLACIPFLPLYDHPVEHATEVAFATVWPVDEPHHHHTHGHN